MLADRLYKLIIYTSTTVILYWILQRGKFLHTYLGGDNPTPLYFDNYPCQQLPQYLDDFYVLKLGYHFYELLYTLLFQLDRPDFPEYLLHHILTFALILYSYSVNFLPVGAGIMFVHDFSDIFVVIMKLTADITSMKT